MAGRLRDPQELWAMSPEEQAEYKRKSIEGGLLKADGEPRQRSHQCALARREWRTGQRWPRFVSDNGQRLRRFRTACWNTKHCHSETVASICAVRRKFRFGIQILPIQMDWAMPRAPADYGTIARALPESSAEEDGQTAGRVEQHGHHHDR